MLEVCAEMENDERETEKEARTEPREGWNNRKAADIARLKREIRRKQAQAERDGA